MKTCLLVLTCSTIILVSSTYSFAQWIQTNWSYGEEISGFLVNDSILFAANSCFVFRSTNDGMDWEQMTADISARVFARIGTILFVGSNSSGVYLSTDNGSSWTETNTGLTNHFVNALAVSVAKHFAGTNGGGVFRTTDSGISWAQVNSGVATNPSCSRNFHA
jgi:photosystem II stability/assembly factor-like uncharacterized protein